MKKIVIEKPRCSISEFVLSLYLDIVWFIYIYLNFYNSTVDKRINIMVVISLSVIAIVVNLFLGHWILKYVKKIEIVGKEQVWSRKKAIKIWSIFSIISFLVLLVYFTAYYPGGFSVDSFNQYKQVINGKYSEWHPIWHTFLFYTVPLKLTGGWSGSIILVQIIYFSSVMGYMAESIYRLINKKYATYAMLFILLNPTVCNILMYTWKDNAFAITVLWVMVLVMNLIFDKSEWAAKRGRLILLGVVLANATVFRHNGILFTFFLIAALFFWMNKKQWMKMMLCFAAMLIFVKGPVHLFLQAENADRRTQETVGVPLTIIGNVAKERPDTLDEEMKAFVYAIASPEEWQENYVCGNFNSIKWKGADMSIVNETSILNVLKMTVKCFIIAPKASFDAFFTLTDMVYEIEGDGNFTNKVSIGSNEYEI